MPSVAGIWVCGIGTFWCIRLSWIGPRGLRLKNRCLGVPGSKGNGTEGKQRSKRALGHLNLAGWKTADQPTNSGKRPALFPGVQNHFHRGIDGQGRVVQQQRTFGRLAEGDATAGLIPQVSRLKTFSKVVEVSRNSHSRSTAGGVCQPASLHLLSGRPSGRHPGKMTVPMSRPSATSPGTFLKASCSCRKALRTPANAGDSGGQGADRPRSRRRLFSDLDGASSQMRSGGEFQVQPTAARSATKAGSSSAAISASMAAKAVAR